MGGGVKGPERLDFIAEPLDAHRQRLTGREDVDDAAAAGELAAPGHLGTFEVGALYSLGFLGVGQDAALAFALVFHAQQALPQIVFGLPFQLHFLSTKKKQAIGQESV